MANDERNVWGIHGGKTGDADNLLLKNKLVALGWQRAGNLAELPPNREAFKKHVVAHYPESKPGAIPVEAGQLFRFVHEIKLGDIVAYPSKSDKHIHIGQITGNYKYNPTLHSGYPHQREIKWIRSLPRTHFKQGTLYGIGSAMSFFSLSDYAEEFISAIDKRSTLPVTPEKDETLTQVAETIAQTTRDFVLKQLSQELKGHGFANFIAHILETMGYRTRVSPEGNDGGVDIIAHKDELGFEPPIIKVQAKSGDKDIKVSDVQALYGNVETSNGEYGLFVAISKFTPPAKNFARGKSNLRLIDGDEVVDLVFQYYEQFDPSYKAFLPLKRVYVPEVLKDIKE